MLAFRCGQVLVLSLWEIARNFVFHAIRVLWWFSTLDSGIRADPEEQLGFRPEPLLEHQDSTSLTVQKERKKEMRKKSNQPTNKKGTGRQNPKTNGKSNINQIATHKETHAHKRKKRKE